MRNRAAQVATHRDGTGRLLNLWRTAETTKTSQCTLSLDLPACGPCWIASQDWRAGKPEIVLSVLCWHGGMTFVTAVTIIEANDIIFTKVGSGLHFNQVKRFRASVFQAMDFSDRDIR